MDLQKFERIMRGIQGALIVASTLQIVVGFSGLWRNVARFLNIFLSIGILNPWLHYNSFSRLVLFNQMSDESHFYCPCISLVSR